MPARWVLAAVLALALAGAWRWLADVPAPLPAPSAPLPLPLPSPTPVSLPGTAASGTATAPAAAPPRVTRSLASAPRIGSEGYGPHIERALAGTDAAAAWEAAQWLRSCDETEPRRHSFEQMRNLGVSPEMMTQLMQEADAEGRRCQTVTAQHRALLPELALRSMRAGLPEAASVVAGAIQPQALAPALREEVASALRRDAEAGHPGSLLGALTTSVAWGLSQTEKLGYMVAYGEMAGAHGQAVVEALVKHHGILTAVPTPQQHAAAKQAGQQIIDRARTQP
ncbi:MAG: hypothetical protein ACT6S0_26325 [Roseateles sp.]|uniref:hypothetical protein n=1 Tax=Roseateles sp. TaxID=1971397 RepID=UPI004036C94E